VTERRIRRWAERNAFTLLFLSAMFAVTWLIQVLTTYVF
jgi:hypothetical protein